VRRCQSRISPNLLNRALPRQSSILHTPRKRQGQRANAPWRDFRCRAKGLPDKGKREARAELVAHGRLSPREVGFKRACIGMIRPVARLVDGQRAPHQRLGLRKAVRGAEQSGEIVEACNPARLLRPVATLG
jgi:hypothetical protein